MLHSYNNNNDNNDQFYSAFTPEGRLKALHIIISGCLHTKSAWLTFLWATLITWGHEVIFITKDLKKLRFKESSLGCLKETEGSYQQTATILLLKPIKDLL